MGNSSAPSGETKYTWNEDMGPRWNRLLESVSNPAGSILYDQNGNMRPRQSYTGERFAPETYDQYAAGSNIRSLNDLSQGTIQVGNNARAQLNSTLGGGYLSGPGANPYAGQSANPFIGGNQTQNQYTQTDRNVFAGDNPYFRNTMLSGMSDIADQYKNATEPSLRAAAVLNGTLGGGDHQRLQGQNEDALAKNLSRFADSSLNQQFDRSAGLEDSFLGRDIQNQQFNKGQAGQLRENELNRGFQNYNEGVGRGFQGFENERGRMMGAIGGAQNEQGMALDRAGAQMAYGNQQQAQGQKQRDFNFDQWTQQQNHPYQMVDWLSGLFGRAQGGMNANSSIYQNNAMTPGQWGGLGLGAASLFMK